jgi:RND family efflux transporter MFP subunit
MFKPAMAVSCLGAVVLCSCSRTPTVQARTEVRESPAVAVALVKTSDLSRNMALTAEFKPYQEVDLMAKVAGYVKQITVDIGDRVKKDQVLATLEVPEMGDDLKRAKANVQHGEAEVQRAKDELERAKSAHDMSHLSYTRLKSVNEKQPGLVAQQEIDDAHSKDLAAEAQVDAAKSSLEGAQQQVHVSTAEQGRTKAMFDYANVTAPFDGVVTKRYANTGTMIQAGTSSSTQAMPIVRVSQNSLLRLILPVPESIVPRIRIGEAVEVKVPSMNRTFPGKVARVEGRVDLATRTMNTEVDVANPGLLLIPGMYAEVDLTLDDHRKVLAVPVTAVDIGNDESAGQVVVVTPENRVEIRKVQLGLQTADKIEIRSGLRAGEMVVMANRSSLKAGQDVRPQSR